MFCVIGYRGDVSTSLFGRPITSAVGATSCTKTWATETGYARYTIAVDVGPKCPSRTVEVTPACATAVLMSAKVWPIWGTDPRGRKTTYGVFAGQKVRYVMCTGRQLCSGVGGCVKNLAPTS